MYPVNQVFLGNNQDPLLSQDLDSQIQSLQRYQDSLKNMRDKQQSQATMPTQELLWDKIDSEIVPLTTEQREKLFNNSEYAENNEQIQLLVQEEVLNLVRSKIELSPRGKEILSKQLHLVKNIKESVIEESNREMELFKRFREFSKSHPNVTYEEFIKTL